MSTYRYFFSSWSEYFSIDMGLRATFVTCVICVSALHLVLYSSCLLSAVVFHAHMITSSFLHGQLENLLCARLLPLRILTHGDPFMSVLALVVVYLHFFHMLDRLILG
jgi:heme exporter protein D